MSKFLDSNGLLYLWRKIKNAIHQCLFTDTASGAIASFQDGAAMPVESLTVDLEPIQDLHGYDSPWPAGGGKNMFNPDVVANGYIDDANGEFVLRQTSRASDYIAVLPDTSYYIANSAVSGKWGAWYDENKTYISACNGEGVKTSPSNARYMRITVSYNDNNLDFANNVIVAKSSSAVPWSPYSNVCPITGRESVTVWREATYDPSADPALTIQLGQTVYGGKLDVTTGTMVVDRWYLTLDNARTVSYHTGTVPSMWLTFATDKIADASSQVNAMYSSYTRYKSTQGDVYARLYGTEVDVYDPRFTDETTARTLLADFMAVYKLKKPITIQFTPEQMSTLHGQNNVWSDADSVTVVYVVDTRKAIEIGVNSVRDFVVHATENDEGGYNVEESIDDVTAAYNSGKSIFCRVARNNGKSVDILPLSYVSRYFIEESGDYGYEYWFSGVPGNSPDGYRYRDNHFYRLNTIFGVKATAIAPFWSDSKLYTVGDYVMADPYDLNTFDLYKCTTDTSGDFDSDAWDTTTVYDMVRDMINQ